MPGVCGVDDSSALKLVKGGSQSRGPVRTAMQSVRLKVTCRDARIAGSKMNDLAKKPNSLLSLVSVQRCFCLPFASKRAFRHRDLRPELSLGLT